MTYENYVALRPLEVTDAKEGALVADISGEI
jgi:hypothetical protein